MPDPVPKKHDPHGERGPSAAQQIHNALGELTGAVGAVQGDIDDVRDDLLQVRQQIARRPWVQYTLQALTLLAAGAAVALALRAGKPAANAGAKSAVTDSRTLDGKAAAGGMPADAVQREVQAIRDLLTQIQGEQAALGGRLSTAQDEVTGVGKKADEAAKQLVEVRAALRTARAELGRAADQGKVATDQAKAAADQAKAVDDTLKVVGTEMKTAASDLGKRTDALEKALVAAQARQNETTAQVARAEAAVARLRTTLAVPADADLPQVLFLLDGSRRMAEYRHEEIRAVLVDALDTAARQTPSRRLGLLGCVGGKVIQHLKYKKPYPADLSTLRQGIEGIRPDPGEDARWKAACETGLNQLATSGGKRRVVYVTCNPAEAAALNPGPLADKYRAAGIDLWVIQLVHGREAPAADLSTLATESGGQFLTLFAGRNGDDKKAALGIQRLTATVYLSLGLREPPTGRDDDLPAAPRPTGGM